MNTDSSDQFQPPTTTKPPFDQAASEKLAARWGLVLFGIYSAVYAGFVLLSAFAPTVGRQPVGTFATVSVVYGFGLIALALVLALVYLVVCRDPAPPATCEIHP